MSINEPVISIVEDIKKNPQDYKVFRYSIRNRGLPPHRLQQTISNEKLDFFYTYDIIEGEPNLAISFDLTEEEESLLEEVTKELIEIKEKEEQKNMDKLKETMQKQQEIEREKVLSKFRSKL